MVNNEEYRRRLKLINDTILFWEDKFPKLKEFFKTKKIVPFIVSCSIMARLNRVRDLDIENFIDGLVLIPYYLKSKDNKAGNELNKLMQPVFNELIRVYGSKEYQSLLVEKYVVGDEKYTVNGILIPISKEQILNHIKRTKRYPLRQNDIDEIQGEFVDFKMHQYSLNQIKPSLKFPELLKYKDREELVKFLKKVFPSGKNKEAAIMVWALKENDLINIPTVRAELIKAIQDEWGTTFGYENFNKPYREIERSKKEGFRGEVIAAINKISSFGCK